MGLGPYGGKQELIVLKRFAKSMKKPHVVLYLGCENDYSDDLLFDTGVRHKNLVPNNPRYGSLYHPLKWCFVDFEVGKRLRHFLQEKIIKAQASTTQTEKSHGRSVAEMERGEIEKLVSSTKELGAVPVVSWFMVGESYNWLKAWAHQNSIQFADWEPAARSISHTIPGIPWENQHSGAHHRSWLNFVIAKAFEKEILKIRLDSISCPKDRLE